MGRIPQRSPRGLIEWEEYERNQALFAANAYGRKAALNWAAAGARYFPGFFFLWPLRSAALCRLILAKRRGRFIYAIELLRSLSDRPVESPVRVTAMFGPVRPDKAAPPACG